MKTTKYALAALGLLGLAAPSSVRADTIVFSNLGPGNSYSNTGPSLQGQSLAVSFTPSTSVALTQIQVALLYCPGGGTCGSNQANVSLNTSSGGFPGSVIEAWTPTGLPSGATSIQASQTLTSLSNPLLSAGTTYWVVVDSNTSVAWVANPFSFQGSFAANSGSGWTPVPGGCIPPGPCLQPALQVTGMAAPVPEPSSLLLLGTGLLGLVGAARKKWLV